MPKTTKIFGPPGSGKTSKIIEIILQSELPLNKVSYVTFGKDAMTDMLRRMERQGISTSEVPWFKTVHATNFKLLGVRKEQTVDRHKLAEFCKIKKFKLSTQFVPTEETGYDTALFGTEKTLDDEFYLQMMKDRTDMRAFNFVHPKLKAYGGAYLHFKHAYFDWIRENDLIDYTGMIEKGIEMGICPPVDMLCVDEWQDLNALQIKQIQMWASQIPVSFHVGDDDQTIYAFSGADPTSFLNFPCDSEMVLQETFRLPSDVLALSQEVIKRNKNRKDKNIHTKKSDGGIYFKTVPSACGLLKKLPPKESCYVLCRNRFVMSKIYKELILNGIPVGGLTQERGAVKLMLEGYKRGRLDYNDLKTLCDGSVFPALRYFKRGSKGKLKKILSKSVPDEGYSLEQLTQFGLLPQFFTDLSQKNCSHLNISKEDFLYITKLFDTYGYEFNPVKIMTIHASKGLEADTVILVPDITKSCWESESAKAYDIEAVESERRVWYTAITRAKKRVIMLDQTDYSWYKTRNMNIVAVFIENMKKINPVI